VGDLAADLDMLGRGRVAAAGRDSRLEREVAVKILPKDFTENAGRLRRFQQEAKTLAALHHPNLLVIHDTGVHESQPYLVSELLGPGRARSSTVREAGPNAS